MIIIEKIKKRDGRVVEFDPKKISEAIWKAAKTVGIRDKALAVDLGEQVIKQLEKQLKPDEIPHVEQVRIAAGTGPD